MDRDQYPSYEANGYYKVVWRLLVNPKGESKTLEMKVLLSDFPNKGWRKGLTYNNIKPYFHKVKRTHHY